MRKVHGARHIPVSLGGVLILARQICQPERVGITSVVRRKRGGAAKVLARDIVVLALQLNAAFKEEELWSGMVGGDVFGSPLLHDNTLFITTGAGELFAFNASGKGEQEPLINGRKLFENENTGGPTAYASLTLAGKYLFLNSNKGEVVVLEAKREARLVGRNKLPAGSGSSPVFSGKEIFLRDGDKLLCIGE